jgi:RluA family pseudouridine synthase
VVINKPTGVAVQSGKSTELPDLVSWWEAHYQETLKVVHRLDVPASGLVALARHRQAAAHLSEQFRAHTPERIYAARVLGHLQGQPGDEVIMDEPVERHGGSAVVSEGGKEAITQLRIKKRSAHFDDLEITPKTGRFHQIRIHLAHSGHPILGDRRYGLEPAGRLHLHAQSLTLNLPSGPRKTFTSPIPWE